MKYKGENEKTIKVVLRNMIRLYCNVKDIIWIIVKKDKTRHVNETIWKCLLKI